MVAWWWACALDDNELIGGVPLDELVALHDELWLELMIFGDVLRPRQRVTSVPWALAAGGRPLPDGMSCPSTDQYVTAIGPDGAVYCMTDRAAPGLADGMSCPQTNQYINAISPSGVVQCQTDQTGPGGTSGVASLNGLTGDLSLVRPGGDDSLTIAPYGSTLELSINRVPWSRIDGEPIGAQSPGKWCTSNGALIACTQDAPLLAESDPKVGTLTPDRWCKADASGGTLSCTQTAPVLTESDPQVGSMTPNRWCTADAAGTTLNCTQTAPVLTETDPQVGAMGPGLWCSSNGTAVICGQQPPNIVNAINFGGCVSLDNSAGATGISRTIQDFTITIPANGIVHCTASFDLRFTNASASNRVGSFGVFLCKSQDSSIFTAPSNYCRADETGYQGHASALYYHDVVNSLAIIPLTDRLYFPSGGTKHVYLNISVGEYDQFSACRINMTCSYVPMLSP